MQFRADVIATGKTTTGITLTDEQVASLGKGKRPPVVVTINNYTYRTTVAPMGGENWLSVSAEVRERAGIAAGDVVDITVELDAAPREVEVPADLAAALEAEPAAKAFFEGLSYSNKRRHVLSIEDAKTPETRQRRVAKAVETLLAGKK
jgi:bifunctional DNA-binding transcriptional regulator/antitoxin component of YhaV-PrlF toxin-antitoxin module